MVSSFRKAPLFTFCLFILFYQHNHAFTDNQYDFTLKLKMDKTQYLLGEAIWINVTLENGTKIGPKVPSSALRESLMLYDQKGQIFESLLSVGVTNIKNLQPFQKLEESFLLHIFDMKFNQQVTGSRWYRLPVGAYRTQLTIEGVSAEPLIFSINKPSDGDIEAFTNFNKILQSIDRLTKIPEKDTLLFEETEGQIMSFVKNNPNSVYSPQLLYIMSIKLLYKESTFYHKTQQRIITAFLDRYIENQHSEHMIWKLWDSYQVVGEHELGKHKLRELLKMDLPQKRKEQIENLLKLDQDI